jgi:hypothetical protein
MKKLLVAMPTYDGNIDFQTQAAVYRETAGYADRVVASQQSSLLANCCNQLYCLALNDREQYGWFMLWHSDIRIKEPGLISGLLLEMKRLGAGAISVLMAIKDEKGLTSTGLYFLQDGKKRRRRLTIREAVRLPETFCADDLIKFWDAPENAALLVNTGLMLIDISRPWAEKIYFNISDKIVNTNGKFVAIVDPEDWWISRQLYELEVPVYCTRKFTAYHKGIGLYSNCGEWGTWEIDKIWNEIQIP